MKQKTMEASIQIPDDFCFDLPIANISILFAFFTKAHLNIQLI